jgi:uncharacterized membrane protein YhaH (DUF805 family)
MDLKWLQWFLLSFKGRINRAPFLVFNILVAIVYFLLLFAPGKEEPGPDETAAIVMVAFFLWPSLAVQAKRWHDINKSAWFILFNLIPLGAVVTFFVNALLPGTNGPNRFGDDPLEGKPRVFEGRNLEPHEVKSLLGTGIVIMLCILSYAIYIFFMYRRMAL